MVIPSYVFFFFFVFGRLLLLLLGKPVLTTLCSGAPLHFVCRPVWRRPQKGQLHSKPCGVTLPETPNSTTQSVVGLCLVYTNTYSICGPPQTHMQPEQSCVVSLSLCVCLNVSLSSDREQAPFRFKTFDSQTPCSVKQSVWWHKCGGGGGIFIYR